MVIDFFLVLCGAAGAMLLLWGIGDDRKARELDSWRERALRAEDQLDESIETGYDLQRAIRELRRAVEQQKLEADLWRGIAQMRKRLDGDAEPSRAPDALVATTTQAPSCVFDLPVYDLTMAGTYVREFAQN